MWVLVDDADRADAVSITPDARGAAQPQAQQHAHVRLLLWLQRTITGRLFLTLLAVHGRVTGLSVIRYP